MRKIFVMGGGGFGDEPENPLLEKYLVTLSDHPKPKVCFIGTASGDAASYIEKFYTSFGALKCDPTHFSLSKPLPNDLEAFISDQQIVYVGGGNTNNMLIRWKECGLDKILKSAYEKGLILTGLSAGMICWFGQGTTDSFGDLAAMNCLGFLKGSASPHFDSEAKRRPKLIELIQSEQIKGGIALDDGVGALYVNEKLEECVSSRNGRSAFLFKDKSAEEQKLSVRYLLNE